MAKNINPRLFGNFLQHGYVTNNLSRAKELFDNQYGIREYSDIHSSLEVITPNGIGSLNLKISLAYIDHLMIELIEPVRGSFVDLYNEVITEKDFQIAFHHTAYLIPGGSENWINFKSNVNMNAIPMAMEAEMGDAKFAYLDTRKTLGHYTEYVWSEHDLFALVPRN